MNEEFEISDQVRRLAGGIWFNLDTPDVKAMIADKEICFIKAHLNMESLVSAIASRRQDDVFLLATEDGDPKVIHLDFIAFSEITRNYFTTDLQPADASLAVRGVKRFLSNLFSEQPVEVAVGLSSRGTSEGLFITLRW